MRLAARSLAPHRHPVAFPSDGVPDFPHGVPESDLNDNKGTRRRAFSLIIPSSSYPDTHQVATIQYHRRQARPTVEAPTWYPLSMQPSGGSEPAVATPSSMPIASPSSMPTALPTSMPTAVPTFAPASAVESAAALVTAQRTGDEEPSLVAKTAVERCNSRLSKASDVHLAARRPMRLHNPGAGSAVATCSTLLSKSPDAHRGVPHSAFIPDLGAGPAATPSDTLLDRIQTLIAAKAFGLGSVATVREPTRKLQKYIIGSLPDDVREICGQQMDMTCALQDCAEKRRDKGKMIMATLRVRDQECLFSFCCARCAYRAGADEACFFSSKRENTMRKTAPVGMKRLMSDPVWREAANKAGRKRTASRREEQMRVIERARSLVPEDLSNYLEELPELASNRRYNDSQWKEFYDKWSKRSLEIYNATTRTKTTQQATIEQLLVDENVTEINVCFTSLVGEENVTSALNECRNLMCKHWMRDANGLFACRIWSFDSAEDAGGVQKSPSGVPLAAEAYIQREVAKLAPEKVLWDMTSYKPGSTGGQHNEDEQNLMKQLEGGGMNREDSKAVVRLVRQATRGGDIWFVFKQRGFGGAKKPVLSAKRVSGEDLGKSPEVQRELYPRVFSQC